MAQDPTEDIYTHLARYYAKKTREPGFMDYAAMPGQGMMETVHSIATGLGVDVQGAGAELEARRPPGSDTLTGQVLTGAGSTVPFLPAGGVGAGVEALGLGAKAGALATTATVGGLGMAAEGGSAYNRAKAAGATDEQALAAGWLTSPGGLLEIVPTSRWAQKFGGVLGRLAAKEGGGIIRTMATDGIENALQEFGQDYWANLIAKEIHSPEEAASLLEAAQSAPSSAIVGALFGAASHYYTEHSPAEPATAPAPARVPNLDTPIPHVDAGTDPSVQPATPEEQAAWNKEADRRHIENISVPVETLEKPDISTPEKYRQERARELMTKPVSELRKMLHAIYTKEEMDLRKANPERDDKWFTQVAALRAKARDAFDEGGDRAALELKRMGIEPSAAAPYHAEDVLNAIWTKEGANSVAKDKAEEVYRDTGSREKAALAGREVRTGIVDQATKDDLIGVGPLYSPMEPDESILGTVIGRKMQGTMDNTLPPGVKPTSKRAIMGSYLNVLRQAGSDSPMLQGGVPDWARGTYHPLQNVVRQTIWGDLATASHEIGHALERSVFGFDPQRSPWSGSTPQAQNVSAKMQGELYRLGKKLYGATVPNGGYLREGFAEYMRTWLTNHEVLMQEAPAFTSWFETEFLKDNENVKQALVAAREQSDTWRRQGSAARADSQRYEENSIENVTARAAKVARYVTSKQAWVNGQQAWVEMRKHVEGRLGRRLTPQEDFVDVADSVRLISQAALKQMVEDGTTLDDGVTRTGPSAKEVLAPIAGREAEFFRTVYALTAQTRWEMRAPVLDADGKPIQGVTVEDPRDPGLSYEDALDIITKADPIVIKAAYDLQAWLGRVNDFIESVDPEFGGILKELGDSQDALHPGGFTLEGSGFDSFYSPLFRWIEDLEESAPPRGKGTGNRARTAEVTHRAKGSGRPVKDILPSMLGVVRDRIEMAYRRAPLMRMLDIADVYPEYAAPFIRVAGTDEMAVTQEALQAAAKKLIDAGVAPDKIDSAVSVASFLMKPELPPMGRDPVIPVYRNGKMRYYEVDRGVYKGLLALNQSQVKNTLAIILKKMRNFSVMTATGLRPAFGLVLNPMIDLPVFLVNTKYLANPAAALGSWLHYSAYAFVDGVSAGKMHGLLKDPAYDAYKKLLLEWGQSYHVNAGRDDVTASRLFKSGTARTISPASFVDYVAGIVSATEKAGRVSEMKAALKEAGWDGKSPLTPEQVILGRIGAKQVTVDYTQAGDIARQVNQFVPFFNAPIQGTVALARGAKHHPYRFAAYMAAFVAATLKLWDNNKDDEDYIQLPLEEKMRYWHFAVTKNGRKEFLRYKKPQEIAVLTGIIESFVDASHRKGDIKVGELLKSSANIMLPSAGLNYLTEPLQLGLNTDFNSGNEIVPDKLKGLEAAGYAYEQTNEWTTIAAKAVGRTLNVSPIKVDHFMRAYFNGLGTDVLDTVGLGQDLGEKEAPASAEQIIGAAFKRGGPTNMQAVAFRDFYKQLSIADGRSISKEHPETAQQQMVRKMLGDAAAAISALSYVRETYMKTNKDRDAAMNEMRDMAKQAANMAALGEVDPVAFKMRRAIYENQKRMHDISAGKLPTGWIR